MDPGALALLIPILVLATGFVAVLKMPRDAFSRGGGQADSRRLDALQEEVTQLRAELTQTQERLEFAERLLIGRPADTPGRSANTEVRATDSTEPG